MKNLNPANEGSSPDPPVQLGADLYFAADDGVHGRELWVVRGQAVHDGLGQAELFIDINPGVQGSIPLGLSVIGDRLFFSASNGVDGAELWVTDGTVDGTRQVADIRVGALGAAPEWIAGTESGVFFSATTDELGRELWRTDGTAAGTRLVGDLVPGPESSFPIDLEPVGDRLYLYSLVDPAFWTVRLDGSELTPLRTAPSGGSRAMAALGDRVFFTLKDDEFAERLWTTDGTVAGTVGIEGPEGGLVVDDVSGLFPFDERIYFAADDGVTGLEPWRTDGTPGGTERLADVNPGETASDPEGFFDCHGELIFSARSAEHGREPWISDGSMGGTRLLSNINPLDWDSDPRDFALLGDLCFFRATNFTSGSEPWLTDGTAGGTKILKNINRLDFPSTPVWLSGYVHVEDVLYFFAHELGMGDELWRTDGTWDGTVVVAELEVDHWAQSRWLHRLGDRLLYLVDDGVRGVEPWLTESAGVGAQLLVDIRQEPGGGSDPVPVVAWGSNLVLLPAESPGGVWTSDGSESGTAEIEILAAGSVSGDSAALLDGLLYLSFNGELSSLELETGEQVRIESREGDRVELPENFRAQDGTLLFSAERSGRDLQLWRTDGTEAGTYVLADFRDLTGDVGFEVVEVLVGGGLSYWVTESVGGPYLWRSDGTESGTFALAQFSEHADDPPRDLVLLGDRLFFIASNLEPELWTSDGTVAGTAPVYTTPSDAPFTDPEELTVVEDTIFYLASDDVHGRELWRSDGTAGGAALVKDITEADCLPDYPDERHGSLAEHGGRLYLGAFRCVEGLELWVSDGTSDGTQPVADVVPGREGSRPDGLASVEGRLVYVASTADTGRELWISDGTSEGTFLVRDIHPGEGDSLPDRFFGVDGSIFFSADDGRYGRELWVLDLPLPLFTVSTSLEPEGAGRVTSDPAGLNCPPECEATFARGTVVALEPVAEPGWRFVDWSGDAACAAGVFDLRADLECSARFVACDATERIELAGETIDEAREVLTCGEIVLGPALEIGPAGALTLRAGLVRFVEEVSLATGASLAVEIW